MNEDEYMYKEIKAKGYVRLRTNLGDLNLELFCSQTPRTCHNFILLCKNGFYNDTIFHRNIGDFMIQGGDPTGTGKGGESAWKKEFKDEFVANLLHDKRGILSMANRGKNTNTSQFFLTYRACPHLNQKHTIFGQLVGGMSTLDKMEMIQTDANERPLEEIKILGVDIFTDPYQVFQERLKRKLKYQAEGKTRATVIQDDRTWFGTKVGQTEEAPKVGKYLENVVGKRPADEAQEMTTDKVQTKKAKRITGFGDFSSW